MSSEEEQRYDAFDADTYLEDFCSNMECYTHFLAYAEFFSHFRDGSIAMLDFGGGPTIFPLIASAEKATRYVHADYAKNNRTAVERWWLKDPAGFNWRESIRYYLRIEGKEGTDEEVVEREDLMRKALRAVVHCDLLADKIVPPGYEGPYDIVSCLSCLECVCTSVESLGEAIRKLSLLVKSGGYLMLQFTAVREDYIISEEEQIRQGGVGIVHTSVRYAEAKNEFAGFKYKGFLYERIETYAKLMESCGFTIVKQLHYLYSNPAIHYTDNEGMVIGKREL